MGENFTRDQRQTNRRLSSASINLQDDRVDARTCQLAKVTRPSGGGEGGSGKLTSAFVEPELYLLTLMGPVGTRRRRLVKVKRSQSLEQKLRQLPVFPVWG